MNIIEILKVVLLGIVEGVTEWLPISSTGHLILLESIIDLKASPAFLSMFEVVIQLGAILAVMVLYFDKLNPFSPKKKKVQRKMAIVLWIKIVIACIPAAILGILLDDWIDANMKSGFIIAPMLIVYGVLFILIEQRRLTVKTDKISQIDPRIALYIGLFQVLSLIPGTSRSGVTILGAMVLGCSRPVASEFSFFLAIPIMFGASFVKIIKYIQALGSQQAAAVSAGTEMLYLVIGMLAAFIMSIFAIRFLMNWVKKHDFVFFGVYRIVLGMIVMIWYIVASL